MIAHAEYTETIRRNCVDVGKFYVACDRLDAHGTYRLNDKDVTPIASMYKVLLALEIADRFTRADLQPSAQHLVTPELHSPGGAGLNQFAHPMTVTTQDLLYLSLALSDNTASDLLLDQVGLDSLHRRARLLGLNTFKVTGPCRTLLRDAGEDFGYESDADARAFDWAPRADTDDLVLERTTRSSAADLARLGTLLANDQAAAPHACRMVRELMTRQVWTSRFAAAFPSPHWRLASKTGTLSPWRGELGIVGNGDGAQLVIAVMVRQHSVATPESVMDAAVAAVASAAVGLALIGSDGFS